ncbi:scoloptoxin SSD14-like [Wyeomyia smithii]|uniref:scoloptoxin SSD14-like n=1 Tax=Wyeomyia smithii TaxID=174621 RepID=UPI002467DBAF|nr:scoloptoxin SSD14-like [Wyeomyia smithii]XP_055533074.1 scoloptoxin SSD14-like [Wyeomyia smithii]
MLLPGNRKNMLMLSAGTLFGLAIMSVAVIFVLHEHELFPESVGAVASNAFECAAIGGQILREEGSAADAAIAMMICEEVACPESAGIGGGFLLTLYERQSQTVRVLDAREIAARGVWQDMFVNNGNATAHGGLAIATPGALKGYWVLHQRYGKLSWRRLLDPTIVLCYRGHIVNPYMAEALQDAREDILNSPSLREIFVDADTGDVWKEGDRIRRPDFAHTLEIIAEEGANALYSKGGTLLPMLMQDLKLFGSLITEDDFYSYEPRWLTPVSTELQENIVYSAALPGGGTILVHMLNVLAGYDDLDLDDPKTWHRLVETFKHAYGVRTRLGDPPFVTGIEELIRNLTSLDYADYIRDKIDDYRTYTDYKFYGADFTTSEDHGTAHVSVLAPNGDAVSVTSTINDYFGAHLLSMRTGIILNGEMDDFSTPGVINIFGVPASPANYIAPGKRPLSSMAPTIVVDQEGNVRLIVGGAGGTRITTATLQLVLRKVLFDQELSTLMAAPRVHHQLAPMEVEFEESVEKSIIEGLTARGHRTTKVERVATTTAVARESDGRVTAAYDPRRPGSVEIVELD